MRKIETEGDIRANFLEIMQQGGGMTAAEILAAYNDIAQQYDQSGRFHHNMDHILEMHSIKNAMGFNFEDPDALNMAILLHDFIYTISGSMGSVIQKSNEALSAEYAKLLLTKAGFDIPFMNRVCQLIEYTERHDCPDDDRDAKLFIDLDMAVIGLPTIRYHEYSDNIAKEFLMWLEPQDYCDGRTEFLNNISKNENLFKTEMFNNAYDTQARKNITWEIKMLRLILQDHVTDPEPPPAPALRH